MTIDTTTAADDLRSADVATLFERDRKSVV